MCQFCPVDYVYVSQYAWYLTEMKLTPEQHREGYRKAPVKGGPYDGGLAPFEPTLDRLWIPCTRDLSVFAMYQVVRHPDLTAWRSCG